MQPAHTSKFDDYINNFYLCLNIIIMAKPIKETPVLKGKDAKRFLDNMTKTESHKIGVSDREKIKANFDKLNSISQF